MNPRFTSLKSSHNSKITSLLFSSPLRIQANLSLQLMLISSSKAQRISRMEKDHRSDLMCTTGLWNSIKNLTLDILILFKSVNLRTQCPTHYKQKPILATLNDLTSLLAATQRETNLKLYLSFFVSKQVLRHLCKC